MNEYPGRQATGSDRADETCGICGGDRRIGNSFGLTTTCPSCHGTGRRLETTGFRDVTKTKASHHRSTNKVETVEKPQWPLTVEGGRLAVEVRDSARCPSATKAKLIREIIDYESSHGQCTQTFVKKVRKQVRDPSPA
ncbi:MAG: molecular chaperone DnaJ [Myxococcota bacterium]|nr:molecular chaperone DnaJ [Myxococcota bacterium]